MRQDAQVWCTGMTLMDGMGREEAAGFRLKNTCTSMAVSCEFMAKKPLQYCKVIQVSSVAQSCLTLCDPMNCSTPSLPVHHQLLEFTQTHVRVGDAIQPSHSLLSSSPMDVDNLISGSSAFSKTSLTIWKFTVRVLLKSGLETFKHYFANKGPSSQGYGFSSGHVWM